METQAQSGHGPTVAQQLRMLEELSALGLQRARDLAQPALDGRATGDISLQFCRYARALRHAIALEAEIASRHRAGRAPKPATSRIAERIGAICADLGVVFHRDRWTYEDPQAAKTPAGLS